MKKNEKETAILIAVCAFISLLILSPFMFFLLSNEHKTETVYSNYMTIKNKYTKVKPAEKEAFAILGGISYLNFTESPEETFYYLKTVRNISIFKIDKNGNRNYSHKIIPIKLFKKEITKFPKKFTTSTTLGTGLYSIKKTNVGICQKI